MTPHPGEIIKEYLDHHGMTADDLARRAGCTSDVIVQIFDGAAPISRELAVALASIFGRPPHLWTNLQIQYDASMSSQPTK